MVRSIILLLVLLSGQLSGQDELSNVLKAELQDVIDGYFEANGVQGISAAVSIDSKGTFQGVQGFSHDEVLMDTSLLLGVGSNTKLFTSVLTLKLASGEYFDLEDSIGEWLDPIQFVDPSVTLRQLLQHNSGINDFVGNFEIYPTQILNDPTKVWTPEETLSYIFEPITSPDNGIYYSNANYILLGMIIEAATGAVYHELVRDSIITPLGLEDIFFEGFEEISGGIAHPFLFGIDYFNTPRIALGTTTWSAGCIASRPITMTKWYDALFKQNFLTQEQLADLLDFKEWPDDQEGKEMGLGIYRITENDHVYYGHGGQTLGYSSYTLYDIDCSHTTSVVINQFFSDAFSLALELSNRACALTTSSILTESNTNQIKVFPNPASDFVNIEGAKQADLYDLKGRLIFSSKQSTFSVSHIPNGVYFAKIRKDREVFTRKIIIKH